MKKLGTRFLPLLATGYECRGGPLAGSTVFLTEHSQTSAYIKWNGHIGRYVSHLTRDKGYTLRWEHFRFPDFEKFA